MEKKTQEQWDEASRTFDTVAEDYDIYRPGYPPELVDNLIELTHLPAGGTILEVGAGTGKATRPFAERGYSMLCLEPGANLAAKAMENLKAYPNVRFEITRFEDWREAPESFDVMMSAQAFHWVHKDIGFARAAHALKTGGSIALFWNLYPGFGISLQKELDEIYRQITPDLIDPTNKLEETVGNRIREIETSGFFGPVTTCKFPWSVCYTTKEYLGLINTYSDHLTLPEETRRWLYSEVGALIDSHGGTIDRPYLADLFVAQKLSKP